MKYVFVVFLSLLPLFLTGQSLSDVSVERERVFTGTGLYGFMNGGSDLYLEYGFEKLTTTDVKYKDESYTIDIYEMSSPENAFGIYSLHTFKCMRADTLDFFNCLSTYQYQAAVGKKYVSIVFQSGSSKARKYVDELLLLYVDVSKAEKISIPSVIAQEEPISSFVKYLRGNLSISNSEPSLLRWMDGISFSGIWLVKSKGIKGNNALVYPIDKENMVELKNRIPQENIISREEEYIYIACPKEEDDNGYEKFGF